MQTDRYTTVFEYLQNLPQPLFEATLLGLMGFPMNADCEEWFHKWMQRPYTDVFSETNSPLTDSALTIPLGRMFTMLGKRISDLPIDKQDKLKNAMKDYCEVCDSINQDIATQEKTG